MPAPVQLPDTLSSPWVTPGRTRCHHPPATLPRQPRRPPLSPPPSPPPSLAPQGAVTLPPRGAPALNCTWSTAYPDSKPSLASAVVHMPDGVKLGSNLQAFNFMKAPNTAAGACATISDVWTYVSENGVAQSPAVFGAKVPARPTTLCASRTYRAVAQFGPYADDACGADRFTSLSSFQPTGGFFTQRRSTVGLSVFVVDCPLASGQGVFEVPQDVAVVALPAAPAP